MVGCKLEAVAKSTPERILDAGVTCFAESGYSGTSTRTLAAAAGVNVATLAYHFKGKEGLYRAAIDRLYEQFFAVEPKLDLSPNASVEERIETAMRFAYGFARKHRTGVRLLLRHVLEHGHLPDQVRDGWAQKLLDRAEIAWALLGLDQTPGWKLKLQALNHLVVRFAITDPQDFGPFTDAADPHQAAEDLLVELAIKLLTS